MKLRVTVAEGVNASVRESVPDTENDCDVSEVGSSDGDSDMVNDFDSVSVSVGTSEAVTVTLSDSVRLAVVVAEIVSLSVSTSDFVAVTATESVVVWSSDAEAVVEALMLSVMVLGSGLREPVLVCSSVTDGEPERVTESESAAVSVSGSEFVIVDVSSSVVERLCVIVWLSDASSVAVALKVVERVRVSDSENV